MFDDSTMSPESCRVDTIQWIVTGTSQRAGFQNPYKRRAIFSASSLLCVLEQCPEEDDVILMSTMMVSVLVWTMVMIVTMTKVIMVIMSLIFTTPHDVVSSKW